MVISQVYGGGGNSGATYKNDFIELHNNGTSTVSLTGWSVQYASAAGTTWSKTPLSGSIPAGGYYLVWEAAGAGGSVSLPEADAGGSIAMNSTAGKVVLANTSNTISGCADAAIVDLVGFGSTATCYEGSGPTATLSNTTAALRGAGGCTDAGNNSTDFSTGAPTPRNHASDVSICSTTSPVTVTTAALAAGNVGVAYSSALTASGGSGSYTWSATSGLPANGLSLATDGTISGTPLATGAMSITVVATDANDSANSASKTLSLTINAAPTCTATATIAQVQGAGSTSPYAGSTVTVEGVVTAVKSKGFFVQMVTGDGNDATSDGIYVYMNAAPPTAATVGNRVCVGGTVQEYIPSSDTYSPSLTEITGPSVLLLGTAALPAPVEITAAATQVNDVNNLEKYEGMRVSIGSLTVVGPTDGNITESSATATSTGIFHGVVAGVPRPFREAGVQLGDELPAGAPADVPRFDLNPERIRVDSVGGGATAIDVAAGATVSGLVGVLDYAYRTYSLVVSPAASPVKSDSVVYTPAPAASTGQVSVAGFNMQRFFDTANDPSTSDAVLSATAYSNRLTKASLAIRLGLNMPDIIGVMEVENLTTLQDIAAKVNSDAGAAAPGYVAYLVEGTDVGGIDVGFLVKSSKVSVLDVTQYGKDTMYVDPTTGKDATLNDRPPLLLRADVKKPGSATALRVTVIANHLRSLSGVDDASEGPRVRAKRRAQAEYLANLIQARQTADPNENIVALGDFNAFEVNDGYVDVMGTIRGLPTPANQVVLASADLVNPDLSLLSENLVAAQRYSYSYDGNAQSLDHMLANAKAMTHYAGFQIARLNADFPEVYRNDVARPERLSDHDPEVGYFALPDTLDVTAQTTTTGSGLVYNRITGIYSSTVTIKNKGTAALTGPLYLFFNGLASDVKVVNSTGAAAGASYIKATSGNLAAGASVSVTVQFKKTGASAISYTPGVVAGSL